MAHASDGKKRHESTISHHFSLQGHDGRKKGIRKFVENRKLSSSLCSKLGDMSNLYGCT